MNKCIFCEKITRDAKEMGIDHDLDLSCSCKDKKNVIKETYDVSIIYVF